MMKSLIRIAKGGLLCAGLIVTAGYATAQQPEEGRTEITSAGPSAVDPAQKLKIEVVDEPADLTLHLADPVLLEQRYVATIRLKSIRPLTVPLAHPFGRLPSELRASQRPDRLEESAVAGRLAMSRGSQQRV